MRKRALLHLNAETARLIATVPPSTSFCRKCGREFFLRDLIFAGLGNQVPGQVRVAWCRPCAPEHALQKKTYPSHYKAVPKQPTPDERARTHRAALSDLAAAFVFKPSNNEDESC